jgi:hypothetical protein
MLYDELEHQRMCHELLVEQLLEVMGLLWLLQHLSLMVLVVEVKHLTVEQL